MVDQHPGNERCDVCRTQQARVPISPLDADGWQLRRRRAVWRAAAGRVADRGSIRRVTVLVLDVGGVVIPTLFESVAIDGFPEGPFADDPAWRRVQRGETTERDYWAAVEAERPDLDVPALWKACSYVRDELRQALQTLCSRLRLVAFTNDMAHFFGEHWTGHFPEMRSFDVIVEAAKLGIDKPAPEAFSAAASAVGERADRCLFIDDLEVNLEGARRAGMHARLFDVRDPGRSIEGILAEFGMDDVVDRPMVFRR